MILTDETKLELEALFKSEVHDKASEIDEDSSQDWFSLTLGWAIAKGLSPEHSHYFARYIRYYTNLG